jgi:DNA-binding protein Fis
MTDEGFVGPGRSVYGASVMAAHRRIDSTRSRGAPTIDLPQLLEVVGRIRVGELARVAGISVAELAGRVMRAAGVGARGWSEVPMAGAERPSRKPARVLRGSLDPEVPEPALADLAGHASFAEVRAIVDRWLLGRVLAEHDGNVTRAAARLRISRRRLRTRWAEVRELPATRSGRRDDALAHVPPSLGELLASGAGCGRIHAAVGRWLIEGTLERLDGNVTRSAMVLGISRAALRRRRAGEQESHRR